MATGRCYETRQVVGFYPILEALATVYGSCSPDTRLEVPSRWPYLGRLLPEQGLPVPASSDRGEDQERLLRAVAGFLCAVAAQQPVALIVDDLHWADTASVDLLQHLARYTPGSRLLLVGTYRDVEVQRPHPLAKVVAHLQREQLAERIALVRLGEEETRSLMVQEAGGADVSSQLAALVHRSTEGNPFFIHEVLRGLGERGEILDGGADSEWWDIDRIVIPESVRDVIGERLSRLGGEAQRILHEASVLGQTFSFEELEGIGEHGEVEVEEALEEARVAGLVQEAGPDSYSFDHALTQGTLYAELTARRKRRLYLAAGETLEGLAGHGPSGREAELANHFLRGGEPGRALTYSVLAGDAAEAVFAHIEAEQHYQAALEMTRDLGDQVREAETLEKLGSALSRQGRYEAALERLEAAAHAYQGLGDYRGEARVVAQIGRAHAHRGTARDGLTRIDHLLQRVTPLVPALTVAELFSVRSCILRELGSHEASLCDAEHAVDVARGLKEPEAGRVLAAAEAYRGIQLMLLGRLHDGRAVLEVACLLPKQRSLSTSPKVC